jgi:hypothetical protein
MDVNENRGLPRRVLRLLIGGLAAGMCYTIGFNSGYDQGEGVAERRQLRRFTEQAKAAADAECHLVATEAHRPSIAEFEAAPGPVVRVLSAGAPTAGIASAPAAPAAF